MQALSPTDKRKEFEKLLKAGYRITEITEKLGLTLSTGYRWKAESQAKSSAIGKPPDTILANNGLLGSNVLSADNSKQIDRVSQILEGAIEGAARLYADMASGTSEADSGARQAAERLLKSRGYLVDEGREVTSIFEGMASDDLAARLVGACGAVLGRAVVMPQAGSQGGDTRPGQDATTGQSVETVATKIPDDGTAIIPASDTPLPSTVDTDIP